MHFVAELTILLEYPGETIPKIHLQEWRWIVQVKLLEDTSR